MGAWIETHMFPVTCFARKVAPYVGAWIETVNILSANTYMVSHPTWVRGLKLLMYHNISTYCTSHPTWVRGLKLRLSRVMLHLLMSHPTWVRGLKRKSNKLSIKSNLVAPYVGAWIET